MISTKRSGLGWRVVMTIRTTKGGEMGGGGKNTKQKHHREDKKRDEGSSKSASPTLMGLSGNYRIVSTVSPLMEIRILRGGLNAKR